MGTWHKPVFYTPLRRLDRGDVLALAQSNPSDIRLVAIPGKRNIPRLHIARRPGADATARQVRRWESLESFAVSDPLVFLELCDLLELDFIEDTHHFYHAAWRKGERRGVDAATEWRCLELLTGRYFPDAHPEADSSHGKINTRDY